MLRYITLLGFLAGALAGTCALNGSTHCPLPPWPPTYNLSQSSIVYQPWCGNDRDPNLCTGLFNSSAWWADEGRRDQYSVREAHWGLMSIDDSTSTQMWTSTTYGGATPGVPATFAAQKAMVDNCNHVKSNGWVDRCFIYDNMVVSLGWYESHRAAMLDPSKAFLFNTMNNQNSSLGLTNYTGLPFLEPLGTIIPCWSLPNTSAGFDQHQWCGDMRTLRTPCFFRGDCNVSSGDGEGISFYWNYSAPGAIDWRVADVRAFVASGGGGVDGLFTDEMEMFPGDGGDVYVRILGTTEEDARAQQCAGEDANQAMIDALVGDGKYLWQAFQAGNNIGDNTNNNTVGGVVQDVGHCTAWMAQRCNTEWVNERPITVQFDPFNVNVSIASFLIVRPAYAWIGYGAGYYQPRWNDAFLWDVGVPVGECRNGSTPGTWERDWTYGTATMDCNTYTASVPCNPADKACGEPPHPPPPPPAPPGHWSLPHNCTSCQRPPALPLAQLNNVVFNECAAECVANPLCRYINWVKPDEEMQCSLWGDCGVDCIPDHCWAWWTTYELLDRVRPPWNATPCDSLPEKPTVGQQ